MKKLGIVSKLTLWYAFVMMVIVCLMLAFLLYVSTKITTDNMEKKLYDTVYKATGEVEYEDKISDEDDIYVKYEEGYIEIDEDYSVDKNGIYIALYNENKELLYGSVPEGFEILPDFSNKLKHIKHKGVNYYIYDMQVADKEIQNLWIRGITLSSESLRDISRISLIAVAAMPILTLISIITGYIMAKSALRPIEKIRETALNIGSDKDLKRHIDIGEGNDELHKLADVFNDMFDRLHNSFEKEKRFASDASHELRTPMAVIIAQCDYLNSIKGDNTNVEEYKEGLEVITRQAGRMNGIIKNLLDFTRLGKNNYEKVNLNLSELISGICHDMKLLNINNISLNEDIEGEIYLHGNRDLLYRMFVNILNNSYIYGKEKGRINLKLYLQGNIIKIIIEDNGIGISSEALPHIFERFYRADSSHTGKGTGLGLAMAMEIAKWHGGNIEVESEEMQGSVFIISLPHIIN